MKRLRGNLRIIYIFIAIGLVGVIIEATNRSGLISGNWVLIRNNFISLLPFMIGIGLAIWWFTRRG